MKVLIVEDDVEIQQLVGYFFQKDGYEVQFTGDGLDGLKVLKTFKPELVILDIMLPSLDGKNFTKIVRDLPDQYGDPVIIMLTAKTEIEDVLEGLELGANDYMKKPFDPRELILRAKKLISGDVRESKRYAFAGVVIDDDRHLVTEDGVEVELSKKEYDLLRLLFKNKGIVLSREKILDRVWQTNYYSGDRSVDIYISKVRDKLKSISKNIRTVKGVGYKLEDRKEYSSREK
ncbi:response regulator transcription factor [uncultured Ilyobacter sp.]|jgi:two-component system alkaline phosphatase synthesis response regulator PhoP|uniref:response regulator transcription factor n=1 Tax=uncultured Ilyobacter sp. TaxID=544433 RepID=UPI0029C0BE55|nr:response regulator transcription factor [uncultured Ilyobacter sp.]